MNINAPAIALIKPDADAPCLLLRPDGGIAIAAGTTFDGHSFAETTPVPAVRMKPGTDYVVRVVGGVAAVERAPDDMVMGTLTGDILGGFHFAPGGNATGRSGGDTTPVINPCSIWDRFFRPACRDPRGMALIDQPGRRFWCDIYLTGVDHLEDGTSRFGVEIADGMSLPADPAGGDRKVERFDYAAATAVMAHHGKGLLGLEDFPAAAFGVTERTAIGVDPKTTKLDAPRTSRFGIMQATGNMWVWGHDGDPDTPRASVFGGYWWSEDDAGSRRALLDYWNPELSYGNIGARGRCDHLQLG